MAFPRRSISEGPGEGTGVITPKTGLQIFHRSFENFDVVAQGVARQQRILRNQRILRIQRHQRNQRHQRITFLRSRGSRWAVL